MSIFDIIVKYREALLGGLATTLGLCGIVWLLGLLIGSSLGYLAARWRLSIGVPAKVASFLVSGIPILILLFWLHYPLQVLLGVVIEPFYTAATTLSIVNALAVADAVRSVANDFPRQYESAGLVYGLSSRQILLHIKLPIMLRALLPPLLTLQVNILQATLFASLISVDELFRVAQRINSVEYRPVEVYSALAVFFLLICLPLNALAALLKQRFTRQLSEH